jgi:murein L,D-transpeptidase YcbB/YkuD
MSSRRRILPVLFLSAAVFGFAPSAEAVVAADLRPHLRELIAAESAPADETRRAALAGTYGARDFGPLWLGDDGPEPRAARLVETLRAAASRGLIASDYRIQEIERLLRAADAESLARLDLLLSEAALRFAADLQGGRVASVALPADIRIAPRPLDAGAVLRELARAEDPEAVFGRLSPADPAYAALLDWLQHYREIKARGGWRNVNGGPTIEPGAVDPRVPALRRRLAITDGAAAEPPVAEAPEHYDADLVAATVRFQARHGLADDGRVGPRTLAALNRSVDARIAQISVNLDRMRAAAARPGGTFVEVNVPAFRLRAMEAGEERLAMAVVVGREARATPIFSSRITEVIFNPPWTVPVKLVREDLLPRLRANPQALVDLGFRFYRGAGEERVEVDPRKVNWRRVSPRAVPYWVRQDPGPKNALGEVRLTIPNIYDVFLHDTPDRHYFARANRALSSGCVRLERPQELVEWILRNTPGWTREAIDMVDAEGITRNIPVRGAVPVHFVYFTAFVENGELQLRDDVYGLDALFVAGIEKRPILEARLPREGTAPAPSLAP